MSLEKKCGLHQIGYIEDSVKREIACHVCRSTNIFPLHIIPLCNWSETGRSVSKTPSLHTDMVVEGFLPHGDVIPAESRLHDFLRGNALRTITIVPIHMRVLPNRPRRNDNRQLGAASLVHRHKDSYRPVAKCRQTHDSVGPSEQRQRSSSPQQIDTQRSPIVRLRRPCARGAGQARERIVDGPASDSRPQPRNSVSSIASACLTRRVQQNLDATLKTRGAAS